MLALMVLFRLRTIVIVIGICEGQRCWTEAEEGKERLAEGGQGEQRAETEEDGGAEERVEQRLAPGWAHFVMGLDVDAVVTVLVVTVWGLGIEGWGLGCMHTWLYTVGEVGLAWVGCVIGISR